jgi:dTDP-4-amino-4,6-dideoxygalactose transaminase
LTEPEPIPDSGIRRANELMRSGRLFRYGEMGGDQLDVSRLEVEFAQFVGRRYCVAVNSGGCALFLSLKVVGVSAGDLVLVNGFTLAPVPGAILHAGARPVVVEIGSDYTIDCDDLASKARNSGAKTLLLSHMRGHIADMDRVVAICRELDVQIVEDCAHALCATYKGRTVGCFGAAAAYSAQTYKHLNAGEGGFLVTDDEAMAARAILSSGSYMLHGQHLSSPGSDILAQHSDRTPNYSMRMTALSAALLRPQLAELPRRAARWTAIHDRIARGLRRSQNIRMPERQNGATHSPTSIQFSVQGLETHEIEYFLSAALQRGVPIKWFGAAAQAGFTSAPRHWKYVGEQGELKRTHEILHRLCDIRTPVTLTDEECDLIAAIVVESLEQSLRRSSPAKSTARCQGAPAP